MFGFHSANAYQKVLDGVAIKTINHGEKMIMTEFVLAKGSMLPEHSHPHEQSGYLVKGSINLFISGTSKLMKPGDSWSIGGNVCFAHLNIYFHPSSSRPGYKCATAII